MSNGAPGNHRRRRGARFRQRSAPPPPPRPSVPASPRSGRTSRLTVAFLLLGGVLIGSFAHALLPVDARRLFEMGVAFGFALTGALAYRRWVRGLLEERRRRERSA